VKRLLLVVAGLGMAMVSVVVRNVVDDRDGTAWQIAMEQIDNLQTEAGDAVQRCAGYRNDFHEHHYSGYIPSDLVVTAELMTAA
jgi:sugar phosphate isomerase/epimerase